jgi:25S rRNA (adenine2142-N1)-methyltransferase
MNTSLFSTSKWVLGVLGRWGWLDGLPVSSDIEHGSGDEAKSRISHTRGTEKDKRVKSRRRDVRVLEVGAINTQLIEAAARTRMKTDHNRIERVHLLDVKAIDIRSTDPRIQQIDFFDLPAPDPCSLYDVVVNSMVINCVTTPDGRGRMLSLCFQHLRPGGVFFLTLPKLCLLQSKFMSRSYFEEILTRGVGFEIVHEVGRDSPKISFFVLRRPTEERSDGNPSLIRRWDERFMRLPVLHRGKKFRNEFAVTLNEETVNGR